ncbi:hypothetical protein SLEP1_g53596 [Rubroshorea leprosula]|uniref:Uncharacterized protein n=1 Tax=Rubroshorea leprosula TaxID=152421 RepID=A0AAV5MAZ8_9ROSI|nr:hypothetical protein SLEP1_g53596 [Rubroshorea leprosula]
MITGGLEAGGLSSKQRKLYVREVKHNNRAQKRKFDDADWKNQLVTFTSIDFDTVDTPHNDPLVTSIMIYNCEVQRVLVDTRSAPDIMYFHGFESLGLDPALLQRYDSPIYGFNNQPIQVEGVLTFNVAFGSGRTYVTPSVRFLVKMASSFNIVIGRPTLTEIRVVASQSHLCMKFPTPMGIATLRGNQEVAGHCYITSVTMPQKGKDQTPEARSQKPEAIPQRVPDNQQVMGVEIVDNRPEDETRATSVKDVEEVHIDDKDPSSKTQIGTRFSLKERTELIAFLRANNDVFAWTSTDMPGIPTSVIKEEVEKLLQVGFVRRVDYCEWVANLVLVKKANGKWRMCIDYTNLNQACPKDCYPMPSIDKLVEATSRNERLSLLDAYSGYHQVLMAPEDEEKTSFYAGDEIYCYVMIPFGLKNAGATYQKMLTIVFRAQIGKNLEVYVDDIVVKSLKVEDHLADLDETFNNLKKNRMRLNPANCIFGMESGKFLSFMVSRRGIEVNPEKIRAIAEMEPPKSAAQKDESGKQKKFEWNQECQAAFEELKSYLSSSPLLIKAIDGEILYLYLGILDEAVSSVLVREEAKQQKPIYYISSVLHGAKLRYPIAEKTALTVVTSARKLRPYFQSHPIIVFTDQPHRQILQKPKSAIQAQALADFIVECTACHLTLNPEPNDWTLYVDGASSSKGSGPGALLIGPNGYRSEHALKVNFDATNNMAEYEALLLGFQLALELKVMAIRVYSDSQLVVNQVNLICEVVDPVMMKYVALVAELKCKFQKFCLNKIPRIENEQADSLSKFASDSFLSSRSVFVEVLDEPNFMKPRMMEISTDPNTPSWTDSIIFFFTRRDIEYALREVHEGVCESHIGARTLAHKVLRYGIPNQIVVDNGTQFNCSSFRDFCSSYGIKLQFTSVYHPESNGMVEFVNKAILEGIKSRLEQYKARWVDELNNVLWAYRTTSRTATAVIPIEIGVPSFRVTHFDKGRNGQLLRENLDLLGEVREEAQLRTLVYKQKLANFYNKRVCPRTFKVGDLVLRKVGLTRFETRVGKLAPNWEGPYTVADVPHPSAYILQDTEGKQILKV